MKGGRESKGLGGGAPPPADLLVCFPSRARLALMPKPICSPVRPNSEPNKRHPHLKKINTIRGRAGGGGPASPLLWAKGKQMSGGGPDFAEPTSPKVTCAGQIKVRPRSSAATCRNWQSVMEEIERLHNSRSKHHTNKKSKSKKSKYWGEALGFKKDIINFLTCLGNIRFDFRCFGSFPHPDTTSDEEDDEEQEEEEDEDQHFSREADADEMERNTVFSKWFMVLQENQDNTNQTDKNCNIAKQVVYDEKDTPEVEGDQVQVPPPNALLLMRCRSAPSKRSNLPQVQGGGHVINGAEGKDERISSKLEHVHDQDQEKKVQQPAVLAEEKPKKKKRESLAIVMKYDVDFYNMASEVSQETWLVGDLQDALSKSRSWKR